MKKLAALALIAFVVTLGVVIGQRMSTDAMAVVVGVVCGVAAGVPTSLLIVFVTGRRWKEGQQAEGVQRAQYPPVVIVNPGQGAGNLGQYGQYNGGAYFSPPAPPSTPRQFRMAGEDENLFQSLLETLDD